MSHYVLHCSCHSHVLLRVLCCTLFIYVSIFARSDIDITNIGNSFSFSTVAPIDIEGVGFSDCTELPVQININNKYGGIISMGGISLTSSSQK